MFLDQFSLLTAVGFSSTALCVAIFGTWCGARADRYLLMWAVGLVFIVVGVVLFGAGKRYDAAMQMESFVALLVGFGLIYAGAMEFRFARADWRRIGLLVAIGFAAVVPPFCLGLTGIGTALGNLAVAVLMGLTAHEYWEGRSEFRFPMTVNAAVYAVTAFSFLLCAIALLANRQFVLTARPVNWAEDLNSIVAIVGLTGIGALSLALNQCRVARLHEVAALTDPLTGLLNRRALAEQYAACSGAPTGVILFDLDQFKGINDRHGHAAGDMVLKGFAEIVRARLRPTDLAARFGGEEFCLILCSTGRHEAAAIAEAIRRDFEQLSSASASGAIRATVSGGLAVAEDTECPLDALIAEADASLYYAKATGRNRICGRSARLAA